MIKLKDLLNETEGKLSEEEMKDKIRHVFEKTGFRKFSNAFRKHVSKTFHSGKDGSAAKHYGMTWTEYASYVIGDGNYSINQTQFENFMKAVK